MCLLLILGEDTPEIKCSLHPEENKMRLPFHQLGAFERIQSDQERPLHKIRLVFSYFWHTKSNGTMAKFCYCLKITSFSMIGNVWFIIIKPDLLELANVYKASKLSSRDIKIVVKYSTISSIINITRAFAS